MSLFTLFIINCVIAPLIVGVIAFTGSYLIARYS